jgi:hypothetical protein
MVAAIARTCPALRGVVAVAVAAADEEATKKKAAGAT